MVPGQGLSKAELHVSGLKMRSQPRWWMSNEMKFSARKRSKISGDVSTETNTLKESAHSLALGDRVRMSPWGRTRHLKYGDRPGLIVGRGSPSSWRVKFDERRCIQTIHQEYLEKVL